VYKSYEREKGMKTSITIKGNKKRNTKSMKQIHGKKEKASKPTTLDQIWGDTGLWKYNTMNLDEYSDQLQEMTKTDLQAHATKIGLIPVDSREMLSQRLVREFRRHVSSYENRPETSTGTADDISTEVKKILSEGR
jgi:hypothetical protein